eukprot:179336_1
MAECNIYMLKWYFALVILSSISTGMAVPTKSEYTPLQCGPVDLGARWVNATHTVPIWEPLFNDQTCVGQVATPVGTSPKGVCLVRCHRPKGRPATHMANYRPKLHWLQLVCVPGSTGSKVARWVWMGIAGYFYTELSFPGDFQKRDGTTVPYCYENVKVPAGTHEVVRRNNVKKGDLESTKRDYPMEGAGKKFLKIKPLVRV